MTMNCSLEQNRNDNLVFKFVSIFEFNVYSFLKLL